MRRLVPLALVACLCTTVLADETPPAPLPKAELDKLLVKTDEIAKDVSALRSLPIKKKIARGALSREQILKRVIQLMDEENTPREVALESWAFKRLGLMPLDMDYRQTTLDLMSEQIAGFYDPETKQLYIADWIEPATQELVLAHEIDHALQDQSFDLLKLIKPNHDNNDEMIARRSIPEGDGLALMIEYMLQQKGVKTDPWANDLLVNTIAATSGMGGGKLLDAAPLFMRETLLFPYRDGLRFVAASRKTRPWSDIDGVYSRMPLSTEQVIHPVKYRAGEKPIALKLPPLPSLKGLKKPYENVFGELGFQIILRQHGLEKGKAETAAAGWGGDKAMMFAPTEEIGGLDAAIVVDFSTWDAEQDAVEVTAALTEALLSMTKAAAHSEKTDTYAAATDAARNTSFVERHGRDVLLVVGAPPALAAKLRPEVWAKWRAAR